VVAPSQDLNVEEKGERINPSLKLAYKTTQQEDTPVALRIVKYCMEIAKRSSSVTDPEQRVATEYVHRFDQDLQEWQRDQVIQTPSIMLSTDTARIGEQVTVRGTRFWPNEMVDIYVHATMVATATADPRGGFTEVITVPSSAPPDFDTVVSATGRTSAKTDTASFHVVA
jgi:hypothetical protein